MDRFSNSLKTRCHNQYFDNVDDFKINSNHNFGSNIRQLKTLQINIRGMNDLIKFDNMLEFIDSLQSEVDILVISETFIQSHNIIAYPINNYNSCFSCRDDRIGGGLALYIRKDIEFSMLNMDNGLYPFHFIQILLPRLNNTRICAIYRPPGSDVDCFYNWLDNILPGSRGTDNILLGDINIAVNKTDGYVIDYNNLLMTHGLITTNTYATRSASGNILDHSVSSFINITDVVNSTIYSTISDHNFVLSNFYFTSKYIKKTLEKKVVDMDKVNEIFNNFLLTTPFDVKDPNITIEIIVQKYNELLDRYTKTVSVDVKLKSTLCPWITLDIWHHIHKKNKILKKIKQNPSNVILKSELVRVSKLLSSKKYYAKKRYFNNMFEDLNQKDLWRNVNLFFNKNLGSAEFDKILFNGRYVRDTVDITNLFNRYFVDAGYLISESITSDRDIHRFGTIKWISDCMYFSEITPADVCNVICLLSDGKGGGPHKINSSVLKCRIDFFSNLLSNIFNESLITGVYPNCLKIAKVIPILKSGDKSLINNYRPISTLSVLDKIFEKLIFSRLITFLNCNSFFYSYQYGFRKGLGTELALAEIGSMIYTAFDSKRYVGALFLDLQKAFDCIDHQLLLNKLHCYGIRGIPYNLLESYLLNRKQYVMINGVVSDILDIKCGVPQGSVLGPLLFLIFINDISYLPLKGHIRIFADDTALFYDTHYPESILINMKHDFGILLEYFNSNLISLNVSKTKFMVFHSPYKSMITLPPFKVNNINIERVSSFKYLGVTFDEHMLWDDHINSTSKKIAPLVGLLKKLSFFVPTRILLMIYFSFIHSRISYGLIIYGTATSTRLNKLQIMQNKSLKAVYKLPILFSTRELYSKEDMLVLPISVLHKFQLTIYMYKSLNVSSFMSNINFNHVHHVYSTRNCNRIDSHQIRTEFGRKSITFMGPFIYNRVPESIRESESYLHFKKNIKNYFKSNIELFWN